MSQPILILTDDDRADVKLERDRQRRLEEYARQDILKRSRAARKVVRRG